MASKRTLVNPPEYYEKLTKQKKSSWRKTTRKIERNEELRALYPPFQSSSNINIIHIHRLSTILQIDELISKAKCTKRYVLDTESARGEHINQGALIQIQLIHSIYNSTVILIETNYLPDSTSTLFEKIKELCMIIFNNTNEIISWGTFSDEIKHFHYLDLIHPGKVRFKNLQFLFSNPNADETHPARESRDSENRDVLMNSTLGENVYYNILDDDDYNNDDDDLFYNDNPVPVNENQPIALQNAVATTFKKFLDKSLTYNYWKCGLDVQLNTWKTQLFNKKYYDERLEKRQRQLMIQYAVHDCTSVAELFFHMYPEKTNDYQTPPETPRTTTTIKFNNDLSDISEDELIEIINPHPHPKPSSSNQLNQSNIQPLQPEEQPNPHHEQQPQENVQQTTTLSKAKKQKKKNEKYKWKKQHHPDYQNKMKRPIYYKYDFRKIRAQLTDDKIYTSHHVVINKIRNEVEIGFKSKQEKERATNIVKINYFSKTEYNIRWGK